MKAKTKTKEIPIPTPSEDDVDHFPDVAISFNVWNKREGKYEDSANFYINSHGNLVFVNENGDRTHAESFLDIELHIKVDET